MFLPFWIKPLLRNRVEEIVVIPTSEDEDEIEDVIDDIDEVSEQLALHQIISEERHAEILERVNECRTMLETSSQTAPENPQLASLMTALLAIQSELMTLKEKLTAMETTLQNQPPSTVILETPPPSDVSETEALTEEVSEDSIDNPPEPTQRKSRFL